MRRPIQAYWLGVTYRYRSFLRGRHVRSFQLRNLEPGLRPGVRLAVVRRAACIKFSSSRIRIAAAKRI